MNPLRALTVIGLCLLLSACGSKLRQPFCESYLETLPEEFHGIYEVAMPSVSPSWSGALTVKSVHLEISGSSAVSSTPLTGLSTWGSACRVQGRIFLEQRNGDGTYGVIEISRYDGGLVLSTLTIDLDAAKGKGYTLYYLPTLGNSLQNVDTKTSVFELGSFILDNRHLNSAQILAVSKPVSYQVVLRRAPADTKKFKAKGWVSLRKGA